MEIQVKLLDVTLPEGVGKEDCLCEFSVGGKLFLFDLGTPCVNIPLKRFAGAFCVVAKLGGVPVGVHSGDTVPAAPEGQQRTERFALFSVEDSYEDAQLAVLFSFEQLQGLEVPETLCAKCGNIGKAIEDLKLELTDTVSDADISSCEQELGQADNSLRELLIQLGKEVESGNSHGRELSTLLESSYSARDALSGHLQTTSATLKERLESLQEALHKVSQDKHIVEIELLSAKELANGLELKLTKAGGPQEDNHSTFPPESAIEEIYREVSMKTRQEFSACQAQYESHYNTLGQANSSLSSELLESSQKLNWLLAETDSLKKLSYRNKSELLKLEEKNNFLTLEKTQLLNEIRSLSDLIVSLETEKGQLSATITSYKTLTAELSALLAAADQKQSGLRESLQDKELQLAAAHSETLSLNSQLSALSAKTHLLTAELQLKTSRETENVESLKAQILTLQRAVETSKEDSLEQLDSLSTENSSLHSTIHSLQAAASSRELQINSLESEKAQLSLDSSALTAQHLITKDSKAQALALSAQLALSAAEKDSLSAQVKSLSELLTLLHNRSALSVQRLALLQQFDSQKTTELERVHRVLAKYKAVHPNYTAVKDDQTDIGLGEYLNGLDEPLDVQFVREDNGIYSYGSKRVFIKIEQGKLILRVGGGYIRMDEFLRLFTIPELEKLVKMGRSPLPKLKSTEPKKRIHSIVK